MISKVSYSILNSTLIIIFFILCSNVSATIIPYTTPPGLRTSPDFTIKADNTPIPVERIGSNLKSFDYTVGLYGGREMEDLNVANFSCSRYSNSKNHSISKY